FGSPYHIPLSVISLNLTTAFIAAAAAASSPILSHFVLFVLAGFVPQGFIPPRESATPPVASFLLLTFFLSAYFAITGLNLVIIIGSFALSCVLYAKAPERYRPPSTPIGAFFERLNPKFLLMIDLAAYLLLIAFILGRYRALLEPEFI